MAWSRISISASIMLKDFKPPKNVWDWGCAVRAFKIGSGIRAVLVCCGRAICVPAMGSSSRPSLSNPSIDRTNCPSGCLSNVRDGRINSSFLTRTSPDNKAEKDTPTETSGRTASGALSPSTTVTFVAITSTARSHPPHFICVFSTLTL